MSSTSINSIMDQHDLYVDKKKYTGRQSIIVEHQQNRKKIFSDPKAATNKISIDKKSTSDSNSSCINNNEMISICTLLLRLQTCKKSYQHDEHLCDFQFRQKNSTKCPSLMTTNTTPTTTMKTKCDPSSHLSCSSLITRLIRFIWFVCLFFMLLLLIFTNNNTVYASRIEFNNNEEQQSIVDNLQKHYYNNNNFPKILLENTTILPMATSTSLPLTSLLSRKLRQTRDIRQLSSPSSSSFPSLSMQIRLGRPHSSIYRRNSLSSSLSSLMVTKDARNTYSRLSKLIKNRFHSLASSLNEKLRPRARSRQDENNGRSKYEQPLNNDNEDDVLSYKADKNNTKINKPPTSKRRSDDSMMDIKINTIYPPYLSPTLNVIDDGPNTTKIAHNILLVHKNSQKSDKMDLFNSDLKYQTLNSSLFVTKKPMLMDDLEFVPIKNNHRPSGMMSLAKWKQKNKISTTTTTTPIPMITNSMLLTESGWQNNRNDLSSLSSSSYSSTVSTRSSPFITTTHLPVTNKLQEDRIDQPQWQQYQTDKKNKPNFMPSTNKPSLIYTMDSDNNKMTTHYWTNAMLTTTNNNNRTIEFDLSATLQSSTINVMTPGEAETNVDDVKETAWSEPGLITSMPIDGGPTALITEDPTLWSNATTAATIVLVNNNNTTFNNNNIDENSAELLKEFNEELHSSKTSASMANVMTSTQSSLINESKIGLYTTSNNNVDNNGNNKHYQHHQQQHLDLPSNEESIIVFKNNHIRPKKPIIHQKPSMTTNRYTAKPPYVTVFQYPTTMPPRRTSISIANVVGHRIKQPDEVKSATLTILDPPYLPNSFMQLPLNTTIVHNNILVPMKEGRPRPKYPSRPTTVFPVYPVVAGVGSWQSPTTTWIMPSITTSSPDKIDEIISSASENNFTFAQEEFNLITTTSPSYVITKKISKRPTEYIYKHKTSTSTTTTMSPILLSTRRPSMFHAINAPPMPIIRPPTSIVHTNPLFSNWMTRVKKYWNQITPNNIGPVSLMSFLRNLVYSLMVMLLPPLALMTFFTA